MECSILIPDGDKTLLKIPGRITGPEEEDIKILANTYLSMFTIPDNKLNLKTGDEALTYMKHYPSKVNIRKLKNTMERAALLAEGDLISTFDRLN